MAFWLSRTRKGGFPALSQKTRRIWNSSRPNAWREEPSPDSYQDVRVDGVFSGDERIVQFFYNGFGLAPASKYYGFYYAESGEPAAYQNTDYPLTATEDGWSWSAGGTDNGGLTRRITGNWFYYEAWF